MDEKYNGLNRKGYEVVQAIMDMAGQGLARANNEDRHKALKNVYFLARDALGLK